jgi:glycine hydroxymethyltransferase
LRYDIPLLAGRHDRWRNSRCINLQPSENILSPAVRKLLSSDMASRYTLRSNEFISNGGASNSYGGTKYMDEIEMRGEETASKLFGARTSLKPLSGHIASLLMFASVCRKGDTIMAVSSADGGYDGYGQDYIPDLFSLKFRPIQFDRERWNVRDEETAADIRRYKPKLVVLGQSFILFPYDMRAISDACKDEGCILAYDASHVLGLVAGGRFQRPIQEGCDILIGSTHKSFPGPQGGIFATNDERIWKSFVWNCTWRILDNAHWNRIAALSQAMEEMKRHGSSYAARIEANTRALGRSLSEQGLKCKFGELGFSRSHQLHLDTGALADRGLSLANLNEKLERNDIIVDTTGRIGTAEVSRLGMGVREMRRISALVGGALRGEDVKAEANSLRRKFDVHYT